MSDVVEQDCATRKCAKCYIEKLLTDFGRDATRALGRSYICRDCGKKKDKARYTADTEGQRARGVAFYHKTADRQRDLRMKRYHADIDASRETNRAFYKANSEQRRAERREYYRKFPEKNREMVRKWAKNNPEKVRTGTRLRINQVLMATPKWLNDEQKSLMKSIYILRGILTELSGVKHEVDHIFPIFGKASCGLHVPWNMRVIPKSMNASKRNTVPEGFHPAIVVGP